MAYALRYNKCVEVGMKPSWVLTEDERKVRFKKSAEAKGHADEQRTSTTPAADHINSSGHLPRKASCEFSPPSLESADTPTLEDYENVEIDEQRRRRRPKEIEADETPRKEMLPGGRFVVACDGARGKDREPVSPLPSSSSAHPMSSVPLIQTEEDENYQNNCSGMDNRPVCHVKVKEEQDDLSTATVEKYEKKQDVRANLAHCSVITNGLGFTHTNQIQPEIRDVLKEDPDFNNIDLDMIDASLMDDERQLKINEGMSNGEIGAAELQIIDLVAHLSKNYDLSPPSEEDNFEEYYCPPPPTLSPEEEKYLEILVTSHDAQYRSVNFGEEMIKEMMMCSMFGIPISSSAAINGYKLCVQRVFKIARSLEEFQLLANEDKESLLKVNADLLVCLRGAIFFDTRKSGKDQVLVSMGDQDIELLNTMFSQAMKEDANMKHIEYKTFNSVQDIRQKDTEDRYKVIQERVGFYLEDNNATVLVTLIILFSADACFLQNQDQVAKIQENFIVLLQKYLNTRYSRLTACLQLAQCMEAVSLLREMADLKKTRDISLNLKL